MTPMMSNSRKIMTAIDNVIHSIDEQLTSKMGGNLDATCATSQKYLCSQGLKPSGIFDSGFDKSRKVSVLY